MSKLRTDVIENLNSTNTVNISDIEIKQESYVNLGEYSTVVVPINYNNTVTVDGTEYRLRTSTTAPYTLNGDWAVDEPKFVSVSDTVLRQDLASDSDITKGAAQIGRAGQVIDSIAELRGLSKLTPSKHAFVTGYYEQGDGGGGAYYLDEADTTSVDNGGTIIVATDGGRWKLAFGESVSIDQFGAKGDGVTDDTLRIQDALDWSYSSGVPLTASAKTYALTLAQTVAIEGYALSKCALIVKTGFSLTGAGMGKTVFKLKDNQSTTAAPVWFSVFVGNTVIKNLVASSFTIDVNGQNNKINDGTTWPGFQCAGILISGSVASVGVDARLIDSVIDRVEVKNSPGVTAISTGVRYGNPGTPSRNVVISRCKFVNNGIDARDHSSVFCYGDGTLVTGCDFDFEAVNNGVNGPIVAVEMHGNDNQLIGNRVRNYLQLAWIGAGDEGERSRIIIADNVAQVNWWGVGLYADNVLHQNLSNIDIQNNVITITGQAIANPNLTGPKFGLYFALGYNSSALRISANNNILHCEDRVSNVGVHIGGNSGSAMQAIMVGGNVISGFSVGALLGAGGASIATLKFQGNLIENCVPTTDIPVETRGISFRDASVFSLDFSSNTICSGDIGTAPKIGIALSGSATNLHMAGNNVTDSQVGIADASTVSGRRSGDQAIMFAALPSQSTWRIGDVAHNSTKPVLGSTPNKYVVDGWTRITNGTGNVLNTDWVERRMPTGT